MDAASFADDGSDVAPGIGEVDEAVPTGGTPASTSMPATSSAQAIVPLPGAALSQIAICLYAGHRPAFQSRQRAARPVAAVPTVAPMGNAPNCARGSAGSSAIASRSSDSVRAQDAAFDAKLKQLDAKFDNADRQIKSTIAKLQGLGDDTTAFAKHLKQEDSLIGLRRGDQGRRRKGGEGICGHRLPTRRFGTKDRR